MSSKLYVEVPEFLQPLLFLKEGYPRDAIDTVIRLKEEAIPHLLKSIESTLLHPQDAIDEIHYMLTFYAMFLLAQFREKEAQPMLIALARHPLSDDLLGDITTESLHAILASLFADDPDALKPVVEDDSAYEFARSAALEAMATLCIKECYPREDLSQYLSDLYDFKLEKEHSYVWDAAIGISVDLGFSQHSEQIEHAFQAGLANPGMDDLASVLRHLDQNQPYLSREYRYHFVDDIHEEISHWHCFSAAYARTQKQEKTESESSLKPLPRPHPGGYSSTTYVRPEPKIGRNEPCPCGSGKKYKKCCGA